MRSQTWWFLPACLAAAACASPEPEGADYDIVLRGGTIYDGRGGPGVVGDLAIDGDRVAALGDLATARGREEFDVTGLAVTPGFINMLSWAVESLLEDGRAPSDIHQGVTLEIFGEGQSMGPLNEAMRQEMIERQGDIRFDVPWTSLGEYLDHLVERGVAPNVASFVGGDLGARPRTRPRGPSAHRRGAGADAGSGAPGDGGGRPGGSARR